MEIVGIEKGTSKKEKKAYAIVHCVERMVNESDRRRGQVASVLWLWDDKAEVLNVDDIGKSIDVNYDRGHDGKAYIKDIVIN